jgi:glycosyltransferase involved in cell wall biosynthesis
VCIYTGRFSKDKNPLCLAKAITQLTTEGWPFRGLFVGNGPAADVEAIRACRGCVIQPFVPTCELPPYYWAADIGVWPKQESTSQLDAAACGLPLILSNKIKVVERVEGNGLLYEQDNPADLARQIRQLTDPDTRRRMGGLGVRKVQKQFNWLNIARQRLQDYEAACQNKRSVA